MINPLRVSNDLVIKFRLSMLDDFLGGLYESRKNMVVKLPNGLLRLLLLVVQCLHSVC